MSRSNVLLVSLFAACAGVPGGGSAPAADQALVHRTEPGTTIRLLPVTGAQAAGIAAVVAAAWFREALRQSRHLDIAAGPVDGPHDGAGLALAFAADGTATSTLVQDGVATRLANSSTTGRPLHRALDELAARTRRALGDPVEEPPQSIALIYSADPEVVTACEAAIEDTRLGEHGAAIRRLQQARRRDGAAAFLLEILASAMSMEGATAAAHSLADEALRIETRRSPTTTHRLLRTMLLCRASLESQIARQLDGELWTLGEVAMRERPYDPECAITAAMALNFLGRFTEALPRLRVLATRLPEHAGVAYHLGWAALGAGEPGAAVAAFERAAATLPIAATVVPRALARLAAGDHAGLRTFLVQVAAEPTVRDGTALHEVRRMQAAHELLCGDREAAVQFIAADLDWLLAHPTLLELRTGELADLAMVLVRIGHGEVLRPHLQAIARQWPETILADVVTFAAGLLETDASNARAVAAEARLQQHGRDCWSECLAARGLERGGERTLEQAALGRAALHSQSPLITAALIENLRALGRDREADRLRDTMRRELGVIDLRHQSQSPLLGPELAYAWLAGEPMAASAAVSR